MKEDSIINWKKSGVYKIELSIQYEKERSVMSCKSKFEIVNDQI